MQPKVRLKTLELVRNQRVGGSAGQTRLLGLHENGLRTWSATQKPTCGRRFPWYAQMTARKRSVIGLTSGTEKDFLRTGC